MANYQTLSLADLANTPTNKFLSTLTDNTTSDSGERVNVNSVFGLPGFFRGVGQVSTAIARCDAWCYSNTPSGGRVIDRKHSSHRIISRESHNNQTAFMWKQSLVANAMYSGDGFSWISRDQRFFEPQEVYNVPPECVTPMWEFDQNEPAKVARLFYNVSSGGENIIVPSADMIHIRNISIGLGVEGIGILDCCRLVLGKSIAQHRMSATVFKHGSHFNKVLLVPGTASPEQKEELKKAMRLYHDGVRNAGRIPMLFNGASIASLPSSAEDMQLIQAIEGSLNDQANIVGVPVSMLGGRTNQGYGSLKEDALAYLQNTLDAWLTNIETELSLKLTTPLEQEAESHFIEFDRASLFATNPAYRTTIIDEYERDAISWEEMRRRLNESTDRSGQYISDKKQSQALALVASTPVPDAAAEQVSRSEDSPSHEMASLLAVPQVSDANTGTNSGENQPSNLVAGLIAAIEQRLKRRIAKAIDKGNINLADHHEVIRESLPELNVDPVLEQLNMLQAELNSVLPEQRSKVIDSWTLSPLLPQLA